MNDVPFAPLTKMKYVIEANAASWAEIGSRTGKLLKPIFKGKPKLLVTDELGAMTREMYGMTMRSESVPEGREIIITYCPWRKRVKELPIENPHRFCQAGHRAFLHALTRTLHQDLVVEMDKVPPGQDEDCCITVHLFPKTKVGKDQKSED